MPLQPTVSTDRVVRWGLYHRYFKRPIDIIVAATLLSLLSPVIVGLGLLIGYRMGRPVLFRQPRAGKGGRVFLLNKFRSMRDACDHQGRPLPDAARLTPLGSMLRRLSLDELPQLWNVLRGDMSLIGPRPLLAEYLERYSSEQARRHEVLPGITGWAQVNGRNTLSWEERFALDVWYVDHVSLGLDLRIAWWTLSRILRPTDVSAVGHATMPEFLGTAPSRAASEAVSSEGRPSAVPNREEPS